MSSDQGTSHIPTVDLEDLASPSQDRQRRAWEAIDEAFRVYGLVYLRNHGLDTEVLDEFYDQFLAFTARSAEEKQSLSSGDIWFQRGWTPPNTERAVVAGGQADFKECFFVAPVEGDIDAAIDYPELFAENRWPEDCDAFQARYLEIGRQLQEIGLALLRGCAKTLGLEPFVFESMVLGGAHVTRALRYLPLNEEQADQGVLWGEEHTDFNLLTLLPGGRFLDAQGARTARPDDQCGLYLRTPATRGNPHGQMVAGKPPAGCMVAQVGQQLEILTGGTFLATPHVIKAPATPGYSRVSMAHFVHLHPHHILYPLDEFQTEASVTAYRPPVLAGTYGVKTLVDIGLAPPEALERLGYRHYARLSAIRDGEEEKK